LPKLLGFGDARQHHPGPCHRVLAMAERLRVVFGLSTMPLG
jgi:hypothetical protein